MLSKNLVVRDRRVIKNLFFSVRLTEQLMKIKNPCSALTLRPIHPFWQKKKNRPNNIDQLCRKVWAPSRIFCRVVDQTNLTQTLDVRKKSEPKRRKSEQHQRGTENLQDMDWMKKNLKSLGGWEDRGRKHNLSDFKVPRPLM